MTGEEGKMAKRKRGEAALKRLVEFTCAYCGLSKGDQPPVWCVRAHEGWDAKQAALRAEVSR